MQDDQPARPIIVALHGFLSSSRYWERLERRLTSAGFTIITIDLLGFGKARKPSGSSYSYDSHVAHVHDELANRSLNQPFIIMGHSMGALIAARYANRYPAEVARTILLHPPLYTTREEAQKTLRSTSIFYRFLLDSRFRGIAWGLLRNVTFSVIARHTKRSREQSLVNVVEAAELLDDLANISTPTLLLNGTKDRPVYTSNIVHITARPDVQISELPVAHHSPVFHPKLISSKIVHFLQTS